MGIRTNLGLPTNLLLLKPVLIPPTINTCRFKSILVDAWKSRNLVHDPPRPIRAQECGWLTTCAYLHACEHLQLATLQPSQYHARDNQSACDIKEACSVNVDA